MPALCVNVPPSGPVHGPVIAGAKPDLGGVTGVSLVSVNIFYISIITSTHANTPESTIAVLQCTLTAAPL